jgi:hypothetical protein
MHHCYFFQSNKISFVSGIVLQLYIGESGREPRIFAKHVTSCTKARIFRIFLRQVFRRVTQL